MIELRLAQPGDLARQKEIWQLCFGDTEEYINFFYTNRNHPEETVVLLWQGEIAAMLTMIPVDLQIAPHRRFSAAMLYAIATHPHYRNKGLATRIIEFAENLLREKNVPFSMLVPAGKDLIGFYQKIDYQKSFYLREAIWTAQKISALPSDGDKPCELSPATSLEYNQERNNYLDNGVSVMYPLREVEYQKKLSRLSGADLYRTQCGTTTGCAILEKSTPEKVLVKELLLSEEKIPAFLKQMAMLFPAREYVLRTPADKGVNLGGEVRLFGLGKLLTREEKTLDSISQELQRGKTAYLGIAFD